MFEIFLFPGKKEIEDPYEFHDYLFKATSITTAETRYYNRGNIYLNKDTLYI